MRFVGLHTLYLLHVFSQYSRVHLLNDITTDLFDLLVLSIVIFGGHNYWMRIMSAAIMVRAYSFAYGNVLIRFPIEEW